jgi:PAS domain S-box-containing protein
VSGTNPRPNPRSRPISFARLAWRFRWILAVLVVIAITFVSFNYVSLRNELRSLKEEPTDNLQWNVTQLELDAVRLEKSARLAVAQPQADLNDLRKSFDLFFSRATTLIDGTTFARLGLSEATGPLLSQMQLFLDDTTPKIDGPDEDLRAALPEVVNAVEALRMDIRAMAIEVIELTAVRDETRRADLSVILQRTGISGLTLALLLTFLLAMVLSLNAQSERRRQELRRAKSRLEATVRSALDAVIVAGQDGRVIDFNPAAARIFGYTRDEAVGQSLGTLMVQPQHRARNATAVDHMANRALMNLVDTGRVQMTAVHKSGATFPVEMAIASEKGPDGTIFIAFMRDISDQKQAETALVAARDEALAADRTKTNFIAVMSHEMRTPLNGVIGALDIMGRSALDEKQGQFLNLARGAAEQLLRHVNDVLDISRIDTGFVALADEYFDLPAQATKLADILRPAAQKKRNSLEVQVLSDFPILRGDPFRVNQIIQNFLMNAIKFTEDGSITVEVEVQGRFEDKVEVEVRVIDTGIGIAEEDLDRVFLDFVMVDSSYQRSSEGTGLGLSISRRLARVMGGDVGVESAPGEGSCFWLRLPLALAQMAGPDGTQQNQLPIVPPPVRQLDVLIVEDNETNRLIAVEMLGYLGHKATIAVDGLEGVEHARAKRFDVILMDLSMPKMDGWTAAAAIRENGASKDSRIIALTAHVNADRKDHFQASCIDGWLTKPLSINALAAALDQQDSPIARDEGTASPHAPAEPVLDPEWLGSLKSMSGDLAVRRVLASMQTQMDEIVSSILSGLSEQPLSEISALCHQGAGAAAVTGAVRLHRRLSAMEASCNASDRAALQKLAADLESIWQETWASLDATFLSSDD